MTPSDAFSNSLADLQLRRRRPVGPAEVSVPAYLALEDDRALVYSLTVADQRSTPVRVRRDLLIDFLKLAGLSDQQVPAEVLAFATKWGPLRVCGHVDRWSGLPIALAAHPMCSPPPMPGTDPQDESTGRFFERLSVWVRAAAWMGAMLRAFRRLREEEPAKEVDWAILRSLAHEETIRPELPLREPTVSEQRIDLALELAVLAKFAAVQTVPMWEKDRLRLAWGVDGAYSAAVHLLLIEGCGGEGLGFCDYCWHPFFMAKRSDRYCEPCVKDGVPARLRQRRHRARPGISPAGPRVQSPSRTKIPSIE